MISRKLIWTKRFSRDVRRSKNRNKDLEALQRVIKILQSGDTLPRRLSENALFPKLFVMPDKIILGISTIYLW